MLGASPETFGANVLVKLGRLSVQDARKKGEKCHDGEIEGWSRKGLVFGV
jgi:hypothetical protein